MAKSFVALGLILLFSTGCGLITKRHQECCCPTDIRQQHWPCLGEDAVFDTPCGPDAAYHGYKPTCWREWQAPAEVWRDEYCGGAPCAGFEAPTLVPQYPMEVVPAPAVQPQPQPALQPEEQPQPQPAPQLQQTLPDLSEQPAPQQNWDVAPEDASEDLPSLESPPPSLEEVRDTHRIPYNQAHYHYLRTATPGDDVAVR